MTDSRTSNSLPRAKCPECGREVALRRGGQLREHVDKHGGLCPSSGLTPQQVLADVGVDERATPQEFLEEESDRRHQPCDHSGLWTLVDDLGTTRCERCGVTR